MLKTIKCEQTTDVKALQDAYSELWNAVENGINSSNFFLLRAKFRRLMMIEPKPKNKVCKKSQKRNEQH